MNRKQLQILIICCGLAAAAIGIAQNCAGTFYTVVSKDLGVGRGAYALHATIASLTMACTALFIPSVMEKGNYRKWIILGLLIAASSTAAMAFTRALPVFYLLGALRGIGCGFFALVPITVMIGKWFTKNRGTFTSIVLSFSGLSGAVFSPVFTKINTTIGWQKGYLVMALMLLVWGLPAILLPFTSDPAESGQEPYGGFEEKKTAAAAKSSFPRLQMAFLLMCTFAFLHPMLTGIVQHMNGYALSVGLTEMTGAAMVSAAMIGNIVSKLAIGVLSDRIGAVKSAMFMILLNIFAITGLLLLRNSMLLTASAFLFGTVYAVGAAGIPLLTRHFFGNENYSRAYAMAGFMTQVGSSLTLTAIGMIYDATGSYAAAMLIAYGIHAVDLCILFVLSRMKAAGKIRLS